MQSRVSERRLSALTMPVPKPWPTPAGKELAERLTAARNNSCTVVPHSRALALIASGPWWASQSAARSRRSTPLRRTCPDPAPPNPDRCPPAWSDALRTRFRRGRRRPPCGRGSSRATASRARPRPLPRSPRIPSGIYDEADAIAGGGKHDHVSLNRPADRALEVRKFDWTAEAHADDVAAGPFAPGRQPSRRPRRF